MIIDFMEFTEQHKDWPQITTLFGSKFCKSMVSAPFTLPPNETEKVIVGSKKVFEI